MQENEPKVDPLKHIHPPDDGAMAKQRVAADPRIARNLAAKMAEHGLSQSTLAAQSGVGQSTISRLLAGEDSPTSRTLLKLAAAFGCVVNDFFNEEARNADPPSSGGVAHASTFEYAGRLLYVKRVLVVGAAKLSEGGWLEVVRPPDGHALGFVEIHTTDPEAYCLRVRGSQLHPVLRDGWLFVIEPNTTPTPGEFVFVELVDGRQLFAELLFQKRDSIELATVVGTERKVFELGEVKFVHAVGTIAPPSKIREQTK